MKIKCPRCEFKGEVVDNKCPICDLPLELTDSKYPNNISKHRNIKVYITPLIILLVAFLFIVIGIKILTSEDRYFKIAMNSEELEEIERSVDKISDLDKLDLICKRCQENAFNASHKASISKENKDIETTDKWASAAVACLSKRIAILNGQLKKELNKSTYDPPIFLPLAIIFSVITTGIILFIKFGLSRFMGIFLIVIGLLGLIMSLTMRTTVGNTYNIGLLSEKHNLIMISLALFLSGIVIQSMSYFSKNKN